MSGVDPQDPSSVDEATVLRDARLARALEHAPDAHLHPDAATRAAVLAAARKAVEPGAVAPRQRGWRSWLGVRRGGRSRMPWNAAFATLLVAGFVTLLWRGEPVPEARMDSEQAAPVTPAEVQPAAPVPASGGVESSPNTAEAAKPSEAKPREIPAPVPARATQPPPVAKAPAAPAPTFASRPAPKPAPAEGAMADRAAEVEDARTTQNAQREASSARLERRMGGERAKMAPQPAAGSVASALPPAPATAPAAALPSPEPSAQARSPADGPVLPADWTHARWLPDGVAVARAQAGQLSQALGALRTGGAPRGTPAPTALGRVELQRDGQVLGVLELSGQGWRYLPSAPDEAPRSGIMDAAAVARLLGEMERLAPGR